MEVSHDSFIACMPVYIETSWMAGYYTRKIYYRQDAEAVHDMLKELEGDLERRDAYVQEKEAEIDVLRTVSGIFHFETRRSV